LPATPPSFFHELPLRCSLTGRLAILTQEISANPSELIIRHERVDLRIRLSPTNVLLIHEETIPERVAELKESFVRDGIVRDPVVIDDRSHVVLDGMHRVVALREMGCLNLPVCAVDYSDPSIKVGVWYRTLPRRLPIDAYEKALSLVGVKLERFSFNINELLENAPLATIFSSGDCFKLRSSEMETYDVLRKAEQCLSQFSPTIHFETERDALNKLANKQADVVVTLPRIDKAAVRTAGLTGRLLPHKVTRHMIPARPLGVDAPLGTLMDASIALEDANHQFVQSLRGREVARRPRGSIIEDRRYEEETFVFN